MNKPFVDYLSLSYPRDDIRDCLTHLEGLFSEAMAELETDYIRRVPNGGTIKHSRYPLVDTLSFSGQAIAHFKSLSLWGTLLSLFSKGPAHNVSRIHATMDLPFDAPPHVVALYQRVKREGIQLSRKRIRATSCIGILGTGIDGRETGTVYMGKSNRDVSCKVYDKRQERLDKGFPDPGPTMRVELQLSGKVGLSLADVADPSQVFYHYAAPALVEAPPGTEPWTPNRERLELLRGVTKTPAQRMKYLLETSSDVRQLLKLADQIGPLGMDFLIRKLERMADGDIKQPIGSPLTRPSTTGQHPTH